MNLRLKTSAEIERLLIDLQSSLALSSKAAVMRLAIGFSLREEGDPRIEEGTLINYDVKKQDGPDYIRFTIFGSDEDLFKALMEEHLKSPVSDEEFFPLLTYAHIKRGIELLNSEYRYAKNKDVFLKKLLKKR